MSDNKIPNTPEHPLYEVFTRSIVLRGGSTIKTNPKGKFRINGSHGLRLTVEADGQSNVSCADCEFQWSGQYPGR